MSELIAQLGTLIGVVVGVVATFFATTLTARSQWNREQLARVEDRKLDAYIAYVDATSRVYDLGLRISRARGLPTVSGPVEIEAGLNQMTEAATIHAQCWYRVQLVGDLAVVSAAENWQRSIWDIERYARGELNDSTKFPDAVNHSHAARAIFHETVRQTLGLEVPGPEHPTPWGPAATSPGGPERRKMRVSTDRGREAVVGPRRKPLLAVEHAVTA